MMKQGEFRQALDVECPLSVFASVCVLMCCASFASAQSTNDELGTRVPPSMTPDVRGEESPVTFEKGSFVVVPIPISNPTLDTALVVGAAYFAYLVRTGRGVNFNNQV